MKIDRLCIHCMNESQDLSGKCSVCGRNSRQYRTPPHHLKPFTFLHGRYVLGRSMGEGGFGIIYIAKDLMEERTVAVKELFPAGICTRERLEVKALHSAPETIRCLEENRKRALDEARTLSMLSSRICHGIADIRNYFEENHTAYIVMEYLEGRSLKEILELRQTPFSYDELCTLMEPVAEALSEVHRAGIFHRDISPDNLMMLPDGSVRILDFGGARIRSRKEVSSIVAVKKGFTPLEQYEARGEIGPWTDLYSLCATIYYCLTLHVPGEPMALLGQQLKRPSALGAVLPRSAERALMKGMSVGIRGRWKSVDAFAGRFFRRKVRRRPAIRIPRFPLPSGRAGRILGLLLLTGLAGIASVCLLFPGRNSASSGAAVLPVEEEENIDLPPETDPGNGAVIQAGIGEAILLSDGYYRFIADANREKALTVVYDDLERRQYLVLRHNDLQDPEQIFRLASDEKGVVYLSPCRSPGYLQIEPDGSCVTIGTSLLRASFSLLSESHGAVSIRGEDSLLLCIPEELSTGSEENLPVVLCGRDRITSEEVCRWLYEEVRWDS